jgi:protein-S-isoprenylcysteine O-methyltransferase Ste14
MTTSRSTPRLRLTAMVLAGLLLLVATTERRWAQGLAGQLLQLGGFACVACAALGRVWTSVFIAGFKDQRVVRSGPYSQLRHPLYALSLIAMLGVGLTSRSLAIAIALPVLSAALYLRAARAEDLHLAAVHSRVFEEYRRAVPSFLPRARGEPLPDSLEIRPRIFGKAFLDAGSLLGYWGLLQVADLLQQSGITPTLLSIP